MLDIFYTEVNVICILFLLFMLTNKNSGPFSEQSFDQQIFNVLMTTNIAILVFDAAMILLRGTPGMFVRVIYISITLIYHFLNTAMCFLCLVYADIKVYENKLALIKRMKWYAIPGVINFLLSVISFWTGWYFSVSSNNAYVRGKFFWLLVVISFMYLISAAAVIGIDIIKHGWRRTKDINLPLIIFCLIILGASLLQVMFYGVALIWVSSAVACGYIYLNLQNGLISTDYLTKLNNRPRLDIYLDRRLMSWNGKKMVFALMIDLDGFKKINDNYGHMAGDNALVYTSQVLKQSCNKDLDFIARLGGDEFIVVGEREKLEDIEKLIITIEQNFEKFNKTGTLHFKLGASMGYSLFSQNDTAKSFINAADNAMYRIKEKKKQTS